MIACLFFNRSTSCVCAANRFLREVVWTKWTKQAKKKNINGIFLSECAALCWPIDKNNVFSFAALLFFAARCYTPARSHLCVPANKNRAPNTQSCIWGGFYIFFSFFFCSLERGSLGRNILLAYLYYTLKMWIVRNYIASITRALFILCFFFNFLQSCNAFCGC